MVPLLLHPKLLIMKMKMKSNIAISDTGLLFNPSTGESFTLNPIGSDIIRMMRDGKSRDAITQETLQKYHTDENTFERDFNDFLNQLQQNYLLEEEPHAPKV